MKRKSLLIAFAGVLIFSGFAYAENAHSVAAQERVQAKVREIKTRLATIKCTIVERQVERRVTNFDNQKAKHVASYQKTRALIAEKVTKMEEKGYDVTKLKADLTAYDALIVKFGEDYAKYVSTLNETKTMTCGSEETDFRAKVAEARAQLKVVRKDAVEIRTFWAKTIRPDFVALKTQAPKATDDTDGNTSSDTTTTNEGGE